ncbi:Predicted ATPase [Actinacidiphila rubida]|uniref:Predicted ATPase n=2 Tax=Actinacidiphila rubida TaxID=310780 RepID=A0A1H8LVZ1_9ACTN|nr:regulator [Actinacidiphila rubida]SEO09251.1 Predicted ATPase [Actinacidiphila rubida]
MTLLGGLLDGRRLVTVTGTGGVGKSRLALRAAARAEDAFPDGVWWADLSTLAGPDLLLATISDAVDLADHSAGMPLNALSAWLADKNLLLVLDSCEHLLPACVHIVGELLTAAPGVTVLATSRRRLACRGEAVLQLDPLPADGEDAVALFTQRITGAAGLRALAAPGAADAAATVCRRLEGIPLAIELAAAQVGPAPVTAVASRLASRFATLAADGFVWPERHRTLRTTIGWSHELCAPLERLLWARLSVFRGPFSTDSAVEVTAGGPLAAGDVPGLLGSLVAQSLLRRDGTDRDRMLDTVREFGGEWLRELGEERASADRHARHIVELVQQAEAGWAGHAQAECYGRVEEVHVDLRIALDLLLATDPRRAADVAGRLVFFWTCCGHVKEARSALERALAAHLFAGPERTRALTALCVTVTLQGDYRRALRLARGAERAAAADGDKESRLGAAYATGLLALLTGRSQAAMDIVEQALTSASGSPFDSAARLRCHLVRVFALTATGQLAEARAVAMELREYCVLSGEVWTRSYLDYQLALISLVSAAPQEAAHHARMMLRGKQTLGDAFGTALGLDVLAAALAAAGQAEAAASTYGTSAAVWRSVGHPQRGTPELQAVRDQCELTARTALGDDGYGRAFAHGESHAGRADLARLLSATP